MAVLIQSPLPFLWKQISTSMSQMLTPDGDGLNECFEIKGVGFEGYEFSVFDRWGNEVFHTEDINECWDGTLKVNHYQ